MRAFGLELDCDFALPGMSAGRAAAQLDLTLRATTPAEVEAAWSGPAGDPIWETVIDDRPFSLARGAGSDHLMRWGEHPFHVSTDGALLLCAPPSPVDRPWERQLLDTVLHTSALTRGGDALHASAIDIGGRAVAIMAGSGGGKTTLASELLLRGHRLVSDDVVFIRRDGGGFAAEPGPPLMNLPSDRVGAVSEEVPLTRLATLGDEEWVEVHQAAPGPLELAHALVLDRRDGLDTGAERVPASPFPFVPHTLVMSDRPDRDEHLFNLLGDLAVAVPLHRVSAAPDVPPDRLADLVEGIVH